MLAIPIDERNITDEEVFAAFDLSAPSLEAVRFALTQCNTARAKKELLRYLETRTAPRFLFDYRHLPLTPIDTDKNPHDFQSSLGLNGSLKEFCLYAGKKLMNHIYVRPGRNRVEIDLGPDYENLPHFNFLKDQGKKHRTLSDIFVRGQIFEYLSILYHETADVKVLDQFEEVLQMFFDHYPLVLEYTKPDASRFCLTEDRDVMSTGWLVLQYISLFYTRIPYEINPELAFEIIKRIWFLGIQFRRFDTDAYRKHNHHMWERGLVPFLLAILLPEIPDFAAMKEHGASVIRQHILDDFNPHGGYSEHSIPYWSGAALCEMLYRGIYLADLNQETLLDQESKKRLNLTFQALALISPPQELYSSIGDNGGPMVNPILHIGEKILGNHTCGKILGIRQQRISPAAVSLPLDYCDDQCGFACSRSSFSPDSNFMLMSVKVNCGDSGHNHMDMLSLFLTFRGQEFIGEPHARLLYQTVTMGSAHRGYLYNMGSHNTVLAYGKPVQPDTMYANKWGVYRPDSPVAAFISAKEGSYVKAWHDAYTTCRHSRTVLFHRYQGMLILDEMEHGNRLSNGHIQRWHLLPDVTCRQAGSRCVLLEKNNVRLLCLWTGSPKITIWKKEDLCPEIVKNPDELSTIIDAAFIADKESREDIATVSQSLLILDVTDEAIPFEEYDSLLEKIPVILSEARTDAFTALKLFSNIKRKGEIYEF